MSIVTKSKFIDKYSNFNVMIGGSRSVGFHICTAWLYTCNDFKVIVIPETAIGIFNALAGGLTTNSAPNISSILPRIPRVLFWNWFNLLVFNVANQRLANSILEDAVNKPWRPSPSNRISPDGARRLLLALIPCGVLISCFIGGLQETVAMLILTWMYNDLGGADENYLLRNLINAVAFMCHGSGATIIAAGFCDYELTTKAYTWLAIIGAVIFTTLQVQDIPDMKGDAARGRRTLPLVHGDWIGRCSVALPVLAWSFACPTFWQLDYDGFILPASVGALVVFRTLTMKSIAADQTTYKIWCLWLTTLYLLPLYKNHSVFSSINGSPTLLLKDGYSIIQICLSVPIITRLLVLVAALVPVLFVIITYRLTSHPLAKYPGPWMGAITDWYTVYHCIIGDRHIDFYKLHRKYGPVVRFGPNRISVNTNTALPAVYGITANTQKSQVYSAFRHFFKVPASMTTIDKTHHAFKRRVTAQALSQKSINGLEGLILKNTRDFCNLLLDCHTSGKVWSSAKDMTLMVSYAVSDIMGDVTFSRSWDTQTSADNRHILELLPQGTCGINLSGHMPFLLKLKLDQLLFRKLVRGTHKFHALSKSISDWRVAQGDSISLKDLFSHLLRAKDPDTGLGYTEDELVAEAGILIVGGSGTTATSLTSTIFYLMHFPQALERLQEEIHTHFNDVEEIRIGARLASCQFLFACIDEAMRLSPAIGAMLPREILQGGLTVDDNHFPAGTDIGVPGYSIHHNEAYFPDPFSFKPERWLSSIDPALSRARSAFCAFGVGRTSCVGKYLAYQEMGIILARMVWLFDMRLQPGSMLGEGHEGLGEGRLRKREFQLYDKFVSTHKGPLVQFRTRL